MKNINIGVLKLTSIFKISKYNSYFAQLFDLDCAKIITKPVQKVATLRSLFSEETLALMRSLDHSQSLALIFIKNKNHGIVAENNALVFLYLVIEKHHNCYNIFVVNWLNWIHTIHKSLTNGHCFMSNLAKNSQKPLMFKQVSDAACFKALYPLLTHIPKKFIRAINQAVVFEIMQKFVKKNRRQTSYSKDYIRNLFSRIKTNLCRDFKLKDADINQLINNENLLTISHNDEIYIPRTATIKEMTYLIKSDHLLNTLIRTAQKLR